jgi:hypothetical protein
VGARASLAGRAQILMTAWGPYDHEGPALRPLRSDEPDVHRYEFLGHVTAFDAELLDGAVLERKPSDRWEVRVRSTRPDGVARYALVASDGDRRARVRGVIVGARWRITAFAWTVDPREDADAWRAEAAAGIHLELPSLDLAFGNAGPLDLPAARDRKHRAAIGADRFGTLAETEIDLPAGPWQIRTTSDDGIRVWVDDDLVIDDWTWHAPKRTDADITVEKARRVRIRVEHFELDGFATLQVALTPRD